MISNISKTTKQEFLEFLVPSIIGSVSIAILILIDGIFIGRGIGGDGLAALSTAVPVFTVYTALGLMIGMGGATITSIQKGQGDEASRRKAFSLSMILTISVGLLVSIFQVAFIDNLTEFLGASGALFYMVKDYVKMLGLFATIYIASQTINCFVRNDNNPKLSMIGMGVSGVCNITMDYLFIIVFDMGIKGASIATCLSQVGFILTLLIHFLGKKNTLRFDLNCIKISNILRIVRAGFPTGLTELSNGIVIFAFNRVLYKIVGDLGVASYSIILNFNYLIFLTYIGISQASQPLLSINFGRKDIGRVKEILKLAMIITIFFSLVTLLGVNLFTENIVSIYNNDPNIVKMASEGMPLFFSGTLFMGINIVLAAFFGAVEHSVISSFMTFSRGIIFIIIGLSILPGFLGVKGVWLVILFAEGLTLVLFGIYNNFKNILSLEKYRLQG